MDYKNYKKATTLIEMNQKLINENLVIPFYNNDKNSIDKIESILNIKLPNSYKKFLLIYGNLVFAGRDIFGFRGIDKHDKYDYTIISYTLEERQTNTDPVFPESFVVIYDLGDGEKFCLDTAKMNSKEECPVVAWYFGRIEQVYEDFGGFFLETVKAGLKSLEERGNKINW